MHISVDIPEPKTDGLNSAILKQFADIQRQLMGLVKAQRSADSSMRSDFMSAMKSQQNSLVDAMNRLLTAVGKSSSAESVALAGALKGLKSELRSIPVDLQKSLDNRFKQIQNKPASSPRITVNVPTSIETKIDGLTDAMMNSSFNKPSKFRNRTFGSNF